MGKESGSNRCWHVIRRQSLFFLYFGCVLFCREKAAGGTACATWKDFVLDCVRGDLMPRACATYRVCTLERSRTQDSREGFRLVHDGDIRYATQMCSVCILGLGSVGVIVEVSLRSSALLPPPLVVLKYCRPGVLSWSTSVPCHEIPKQDC